MEDGLRFAIREGGRTVGAGRVTKITKYLQQSPKGPGPRLGGALLRARLASLGRVPCPATPAAGDRGGPVRGSRRSARGALPTKARPTVDRDTGRQRAEPSTAGSPHRPPGRRVQGSDCLAEDLRVPVDVGLGVVRAEQRHVVERGEQHAPVEAHRCMKPSSSSSTAAAAAAPSRGGGQNQYSARQPRRWTCQGSSCRSITAGRPR